MRNGDYNRVDKPAAEHFPVVLIDGNVGKNAFAITKARRVDITGGGKGHSGDLPAAYAVEVSRAYSSDPDYPHSDSLHYFAPA